METENKNLPKITFLKTEVRKKVPDPKNKNLQKTTQSYRTKIFFLMINFHHCHLTKYIGIKPSYRIYCI